MPKVTDNHFYTIIVQIEDGGIYVSQFFSKNEIEAVNTWINCLLENNTIEELSMDDLLELLNDINDSDNRIVLLDDRFNVWFNFYKTDKKSLFVNIIKTATPTEEESKLGKIAKNIW
nr:hypothetical protein [uncultured Flavobacterium sp.]